MKILPSGNWSATWTDYRNRGPAFTYYRKADIVRVLKNYGYDVTATPNTDLTHLINGAEFVAGYVEPYRVVYA